MTKSDQSAVVRAQIIDEIPIFLEPNFTNEQYVKIIDYAEALVNAGDSITVATQKAVQHHYNSQ